MTLLLSRARCVGLTVAVMYVECAPACLAFPVGDRMSYCPVLLLHRLVREWPFHLLHTGGTRSV